MSTWLKQSTAVTLAVGPFVDDTDGKTAETALTLTQADFRLSKNGAAFAQKNDATSGTHMENGYYSVPLNTTDTNTLGTLKLAVNETGALPVWVECMVVPANVWDSLFGADQLQVHVNEMTAGIITATVIAADAIGASELAADAVTEIQSGLATAAALTTVDDFLDTEIAAIVAALIIRSATAQAGAAGTITLDASASAVDDFYNGTLVLITSGTGVGQVRLITDYVGSTKVATIGPNWQTNPSATSVFSILPASYVQGVVALAAGSITAGVIATDAIDDDALSADAITAIQSGLATAAALTTVDDFLDTEIAAIKTKTDNLPTDPADASDIAAATTAIAAYIDTEVAAILAAVDTEVAAIKAKTDNLPAAPAAVGDIPTAAAIADAVLDDAITQPGGVFSWGSATLRNIVGWIGVLSRNKILETSTLTTLRNDADSGDLATSVVSDDLTTLTRGEWS